MTELDPASKQLLAQMLAGAEMPDDRHDAIYEDVEASIAADLPPRIGEGPVEAPANGRRRVGILVAVGGALAAAGLVAGLTLSQTGVWSSKDDETSPQSAEMIDQRDDAGGVAEARDPEPKRSPASKDAPEPEDEPDLVIEDDEPDGSKTRLNKRRTGPADPREEMTLLLQARKDVNAGRYDAALAAIRKHARTYPKSSFAQERRLLEVKAHCGAGHLDKAKALIGRHAKSTPGMRDACPAAE